MNVDFSITNDWIEDGLRVLTGLREGILGIGDSFGSFLEPFHALALEDISHVPRRLSSGLMPGEVQCLSPGMRAGFELADNIYIYRWDQKHKIWACSHMYILYIVFQH